MQARHPNLTEKQARSNSPYPTITPDHMLAAARQLALYLESVMYVDFEMRIFENGSVLLRNVNDPELGKIFSLAQIQEASQQFWLNPRRPLWQHIFWMWG